MPPCRYHSLPLALQTNLIKQVNRFISSLDGTTIPVQVGTSVGEGWNRHRTTNIRSTVCDIYLCLWTGLARAGCGAAHVWRPRCAPGGFAAAITVDRDRRVRAAVLLVLGFVSPPGQVRKRGESTCVCIFAGIYMTYRMFYGVGVA